MLPRSLRAWFEVLLFCLALGLAVAAGALASDEDTANICYFGAWSAALLLLFSLALRLPLRWRGRYARFASAGLVVAAVGLVLVANIALYRHDVHLDVTAEKRYTAPPQFLKIVRALDRDVTITYFYNDQDGAAITAREVLAAVARNHPHLRVHALDLDKELVAARTFGVRVYNTAVVQLDSRRIEVDNTTDLTPIAFAIERAMKQDTPIVCFVTGHGEPYNPRSHVHITHREILGAENTPALDATPGGVDRLTLALEAIGYSERGLTTATATSVPADCAIVADLGPRTTYSPDETKLFGTYLAHGGRLLLMYDPEFPVTPDTQAMLGELGLGLGEGAVVDPTNHSGSESDKVAVPYYTPHPITAEVALTVFPAPRPLQLLRRVPNIEAVPLVQTSEDSYVRKLAGTLATLAAAEVGAPHAMPTDVRGPRTLLIAEQGVLPGGDRPFRLVLAGSAGFATNAFFPYASNGELAVSIVRWLAGDLSAPKLRPMTYSLQEIRLSPQQMQATFVVVEILLPLSVILLGLLVWRRRR